MKRAMVQAIARFIAYFIARTNARSIDRPATAFGRHGSI